MHKTQQNHTQTKGIPAIKAHVQSAFSRKNLYASTHGTRILLKAAFWFSGVVRSNSTTRNFRADNLTLADRRRTLLSPDEFTPKATLST